MSNIGLLSYKKALIDANILINNNSIEHCNFPRESELNAARKLLYSSNNPDGILAFSDQIAIDAMLAANERGIIMPKSLLNGYD